LQLEFNVRGEYGLYGRNIAALRAKNKLSQRRLAVELNISSGALGMYETEKREPDIKTMQKIADYFGVDISFIVTGKFAADQDPLLERIRTLSKESREEIERFTSLLELKERHESDDKH
jgi:transcriptional regulator with XRE-family HTH domain